MKFENTEVWGFKHAFRGMRNPHQSWDKSDSFECVQPDTVCNTDECALWDQSDGSCSKAGFLIGPDDMALAKNLCGAGPEHRKFLRQIFVSVDITAPAYFMAELDTYKVGVVRNSTSFMHRKISEPFLPTDFEGADTNDETWWAIIKRLNELRTEYLKNHDADIFLKVRRLLPMSYLYTSTMTMNYENVRTMYHQRKFHRLPEWSESFCSWVKTLPYAKDLIIGDE